MGAVTKGAVAGAAMDAASGGDSIVDGAIKGAMGGAALKYGGAAVVAAGLGYAAYRGVQSYRGRETASA